MSITFTDVLSILRDLVDILLVWFVIYFILKNIKNNINDITKNNIPSTNVKRLINNSNPLSFLSPYRYTNTF